MKYKIHGAAATKEAINVKIAIFVSCFKARVAVIIQSAMGKIVKNATEAM